MEEAAPAVGVRLEGGAVRFGGRDALCGIDLELGAGATAVVGANGAGKTTLLRVLATLIPPGGRLEIAGEDVSTSRGLRAARRQLGFLAADPDFARGHTVEEAVTYGAWLHRMNGPERARAVDEALAAVGLEGRRRDRITALSTGLRRRAFLAQAIVHRPSVLLLDEPTAAVDPEHRGSVRRLIEQSASLRTVVFSTHLAEDVRFAAADAIVLHQGRVAWSGPAADLLALGVDHASDEREGELEAAIRTVATPRTARAR
jgi:ABC-2 type transport system ATP-binding protein